MIAILIHWLRRRGYLRRLATRRSVTLLQLLTWPLHLRGRRPRRRNRADRRPALLAEPLFAAVGREAGAGAAGLPQARANQQHVGDRIGISFDNRPPCGFRWLRRMCLIDAVHSLDDELASARGAPCSTLPARRGRRR